MSLAGRWDGWSGKPHRLRNNRENGTRPDVPLRGPSWRIALPVHFHSRPRRTLHRGGMAIRGKHSSTQTLENQSGRDGGSLLLGDLGEDLGVLGEVLDLIVVLDLDEGRAAGEDGLDVASGHVEDLGHGLVQGLRSQALDEDLAVASALAVGGLLRGKEKATAPQGNLEEMKVAWGKGVEEEDLEVGLHVAKVELLEDRARQLGEGARIVELNVLGDRFLGKNKTGEGGEERRSRGPCRGS